MKLHVFLDEPLEFIITMEFDDMPKLDSTITIYSNLYKVHRITSGAIFVDKIDVGDRDLLTQILDGIFNYSPIFVFIIIFTFVGLIFGIVNHNIFDFVLCIIGLIMIIIGAIFYYDDN